MPQMREQKVLTAFVGNRLQRYFRDPGRPVDASRDSLAALARKRDPTAIPSRYLPRGLDDLSGGLLTVLGTEDLNRGLRGVER